jgi:hypothetical protein
MVWVLGLAGASCRYNAVKGAYCQATDNSTDCQLCYTPEEYAAFDLAPTGPPARPATPRKR